MAERGIRAGRAFVELSTDNTRLTRGLRRAQAKLRAFSQSVDRLGQSTRDIGGRLVRIGGLAAAGFGVAAAIFGRFDDQMRTVQAVTQATEEEFEALREEAKRLGGTTSFTASQVAGLMVELGRAGFASDEVKRATESILNLARATDTGLARSAEIAANTLRSFNLEANEMGRVSDVLAAGANKSSQDLETLFNSLTFVAADAKQAGLSLEGLVTDIAILADNGIKGSKAGTRLRRMIANLSKEAKRNEINELGVDVKDAEGNFRSMTEILLDFQEATADMGEVERAGKIAEIFGVRAKAAVQKLMDAAESGDLQQFKKELENIAGFADETAEKMDAGIGGAFRRMISAVNILAIEIGNATKGEFTDLLQLIKNTGRAARDWVKENQKLVSSIFKTTLAVTGAGAAIFALGASIQIVSFALGGFAKALGSVFKLILATKVAIAALTTPIGLVVAGFASLSAGILGATGALEKAVTFMKKKFGQIGTIATETFAGIRDALLAGDIQAAWDVVTSGLTLAWQKATAELENIWIDFKASFLTTFNDIWFGARAILNDAIASMQSLWVNFTSFLQKKGVEFANKFATAWDLITTKTAQGINRVRAKVDDSFSESDADRQNRLLGDKFAGRQRDREQALKSQRQEIEAQRKARQEQIEQEREAAEQELGDELSAAQRKARQQQKREQQAAQQELDQARDRFDAAREAADQAADRAQNAGDEAGEDGDGGSDSAKDKADETSTSASAGVASSFQKAGAAGTFNPFALRGLSRGQGEDNIVKANERVAAEVKKLNRNLIEGLEVG